MTKKYRSNSQHHYMSRRKFLLGATAALAGTFIPSTLGLPAQQANRRQTWSNVKPALAQTSQKIIADHNAVALYDQIPQSYFNEVKKMWVTVPGESHSAAYRDGCQLLENLDSKFAVSVQESGTPAAYTDQHLRISRATWGDLTHATGWRYGYGEEDWFTSAPAIAQTKAHLTYANTNGFNIAAMGFGWCWDMTWHASGWTDIENDLDPVYNVHWDGSTVYGPEGNTRWGLDAADQALTGNSVCLDTYLNATEEYIAHCLANNYPTQMFFTTGPVDGGAAAGERGYQRYLKNQRIRDHVNANNRVLFDYADILCWDNSGVQSTTTWQDYGGTTQTFPRIVPAFDTEETGHIDNDAALRLGKAMWWMLARIAGWGLDTNPPGQPQNVRATPSSFCQIDLSWDACTDPEGGPVTYRIYRGGVDIGSTSDTSFSDKGVAASTQYTYTIYACDTAGNTSDASDPASATTGEAPFSVFLPLIQR
jgi:hypothetical protein